MINGIIELLQKNGYHDVSKDFTIIPFQEILRKGDPRTTQTVRSYLFRKPGIKVVVDALHHYIWTSETMKNNKPFRMIQKDENGNAVSVITAEEAIEKVLELEQM